MTKKIILYGLAFIMLSLFLSPPANAKVVKLGKAFSENIGINTKDMPTRTDPIIKLDCVRSKDCGVDGTKFCSNNKCVPCTYSCPGGYSPTPTGKCGSRWVIITDAKSNPTCSDESIMCYTDGADCSPGTMCSKDKNMCVACTYSCPSGFSDSWTGKCASKLVSVAGDKGTPACPNQNLWCYTAGEDCASGSVCSENSCVACTYSCPSGHSTSSTGKCGYTIGTFPAVKSNGACPDRSETCYSAGFSCAEGSSCVKGYCQNDTKCSSTPCASGYSCDPRYNTCRICSKNSAPGSCGCGENQRPNGLGGCMPLSDPCAKTSCNPGQLCDPYSGGCVPCSKNFDQSCGCPTGQQPNGSGECMVSDPCDRVINPCASANPKIYEDGTEYYNNPYYYEPYGKNRDICVPFGPKESDYACVECSSSADCRKSYNITDSGFTSACVASHPYATGARLKATAFCASRCMSSRLAAGASAPFEVCRNNSPAIAGSHSGPTPYICTGRGFGCSEKTNSLGIPNTDFSCKRSKSDLFSSSSESHSPQASNCGRLFGGCSGSGSPRCPTTVSGTPYTISCLDDSDTDCQRFFAGNR